MHNIIGKPLFYFLFEKFRLSPGDSTIYIVESYKVDAIDHLWMKADIKRETFDRTLRYCSYKLPVEPSFAHSATYLKRIRGCPKSQILKQKYFSLNQNLPHFCQSIKFQYARCSRTWLLAHSRESREPLSWRPPNVVFENFSMSVSFHFHTDRLP